MPIDCIVINLTRFGDLLQSQPLLHDLHRHGLRTGLVCLENFANTLPLLSGCDAAWKLRGAHILRTLDRDWRSACTDLLDFTHTILEEARPRYIINLTATIAARLLTSLLSRSARPLGFALDEEGFGVNHGSWATFLSGTTLCRQNAVFHISDLFRFFAGPALDRNQETDGKEESGLARPADAAADEVDALLQDLPPNRGLVAFQLGASEERRQWPASSFAELGDRLYSRAGLLPVLTGTAQERSLSDEYIRLAGCPYRDLTGRTALPVLQALLSRVRLLVSNDTGTLHLAAGMKTPCVGIFLATAQPWDTGPYLSDCLCIEPDLPCHPCSFRTSCPSDFHCRTSIRPEPVADQILQFLEQGTWKTVASDHRMRLWRTTTDPDGLFDLESLSGHARAARTLWIRHQRLFWRQFLGEMDRTQIRQNHPQNHPQSHLQIPPYIPSLPACPEDLQKQVLPTLEQVRRILLLLIEQLPVLGTSAAAGKLFLRNCDRIQTLLTSTDNLVSLGMFWAELRTDTGKNLDDLAQSLGYLSRYITEFISNIQYGTDYAKK